MTKFKVGDRVRFSSQGAYVWFHHDVNNVGIVLSVDVRHVHVHGLYSKYDSFPYCPEELELIEEYPELSTKDRLVYAAFDKEGNPLGEGQRLRKKLPKIFGRRVDMINSLKSSNPCVSPDVSIITYQLVPVMIQPVEEFLYG